MAESGFAGRSKKKSNALVVESGSFSLADVLQDSKKPSGCHSVGKFLAFVSQSGIYFGGGLWLVTLMITLCPAGLPLLCPARLRFFAILHNSSSSASYFLQIRQGCLKIEHFQSLNLWHNAPPEPFSPLIWVQFGQHSPKKGTKGGFCRPFPPLSLHSQNDQLISVLLKVYFRCLFFYIHPHSSKAFRNLN